MDLDDDSENDSDYAPGEEAGSDSEPEPQILIEEISVSRKRRMDDIFKEMHNEEVKVTKTKVACSLAHAGRKRAKLADGSSKKKKKVPKAFNAIASIFGKSAAKKMLHMNSSVTIDPREVSAAEADGDGDGTDSMPNVLRQRAREIARNALSKSVVVDVVKFAGKDIE